MAWGPNREVKTWPKYFVNGFKFHTTKWGEGKATINSGVWVKGIDGECADDDYFGLLQEVLELEYPGEPTKKVVLFSCEWFDPTPRQGTRIVHPEYKIIEVRKRGRYRKYDPFVIAQQARQVYYVPHPGKIRDKVNWFAVIKTKARGRVEVEDSLEVAYQNDIASHTENVTYDDIQEPLMDQSMPWENVNLVEPSNVEFINDEDVDADDAPTDVEDDNEEQEFSSYESD